MSRGEITISNQNEPAVFNALGYFIQTVSAVPRELEGDVERWYAFLSTRPIGIVIFAEDRPVRNLAALVMENSCHKFSVVGNKEHGRALFEGLRDAIKAALTEKNWS